MLINVKLKYQQIPTIYMLTTTVQQGLAVTTVQREGIEILRVVRQTMTTPQAEETFEIAIESFLNALTNINLQPVEEKY